MPVGPLRALSGGKGVNSKAPWVRSGARGAHRPFVFAMHTAGLYLVSFSNSLASGSGSEAGNLSRLYLLSRRKTASRLCSYILHSFHETSTTTNTSVGFHDKV